MASKGFSCRVWTSSLDLVSFPDPTSRVWGHWSNFLVVHTITWVHTNLCICHMTAELAEPGIGANVPRPFPCERWGLGTRLVCTRHWHDNDHGVMWVTSGHIAWVQRCVVEGTAPLYWKSVIIPWPPLTCLPAILYSSVVLMGERESFDDLFHSPLRVWIMISATMFHTKKRSGNTQEE